MARKKTPTKRKFKAREFATFKKKDAQRIGEELENIKSKGTLNPETIVNRARNRNSILHQYLEWDNVKAGHQWRLDQARHITRHIVEVVMVNGVQVEERAFFSVVGIKEKANIYVSLGEAISTPSYRRQLLTEMKTKLQSLMQLIDLFTSVDK